MPKTICCKTMNATSKTLRQTKLPPIPRGPLATKHMTAAAVERGLRTDGFKPTDPETKRCLKASGNWGMPNE